MAKYKLSEQTRLKMSEAKKGNKYAEVWNKETIAQMLYDIKEFLESNQNVYTITTALTQFNLYSQWWSEMAEKFRENVLVSESIKGIEAIIEQRIVNDTMTGDAKSATFSIFLLKNKFGYVDKQETDNTHKVTGVDLKSAIQFE